MFDFTGLIRKFEENYNTNIDIRNYAAHMCYATTRTPHDGRYIDELDGRYINEFFYSIHELFHNIYNPYPIQITYNGQNQFYGDNGQNQLYDISTFECKTYTFRSKQYNIIPQHFIETLIISSRVKSIPNNMFRNLVGLKKVKFENGSQLEHMGDSCFEECHSLQHINLPNTLKSMGDRVFRGCYWLGTVNIASSNISTIGFQTFHNCFNLKKILFPTSLRSIQHSGFENCLGLSHVSLPDNFESFGVHSMKKCKSLKALYLPSNFNPQEFERYYTQFNPTEVIDHMFDTSLILLFDKVEGVQWGRVTSDNNSEENLLEENQDRVDEQMVNEEHDDEDKDEDEESEDSYCSEFISDDDYDDEHFCDDDDDENEERSQFRDLKDFPNIAPFISLFDINNHIRSIDYNADPSVVMNWLKSNSTGFYVAVVKHHMSLLHILCHFPSNCDQVYTCVNEVIRKCPEMIKCVDKTGRTPLHHLIEFNPKRDPNVVRCLASNSNGSVVFAMIKCEQCETDVKLAIIESIVCANHEALKCEDEETGLMPFMFACMGEEYNLSVAYKLLQKMPDYLKNV